MNREDLDCRGIIQEMERAMAEMEERRIILMEKLLRFQDERESLYTTFPQDEEYFDELSQLSAMESYLQREIDEIDYRREELEKEIEYLKH